MYYVPEKMSINTNLTLSIIPFTAEAASLLVLPDGTFSGPDNHNLLVENKNLTIRSQSGDPLSCQVDVGGYSYPQSVFFLFCTGDLDHEVVVEGLTLRSGYSFQAGGSHGGAIFVYAATAEVRNCLFADNEVEGGYGGAFSLYGEGEHAVTWRGIGEQGRQLPGGLYLMRFEAAGVAVTRKLMLLK